MTTEGPQGHPMDGVARIAAERERQRAVEGWTDDHDDEHTDESMAKAAALYALPYRHHMSYGPFVLDMVALLWPWERKWWNPKGRIRDLERAGALIAAEIDRLLRERGDD